MIQIVERVIVLTKKALREKLLILLRNQKEEIRLRKSKVIQNKLFALPEFLRARTVLFYMAFDGEVETSEMIKQAFRLGKKIALPTVIREDKKIVPALIDNLDKDLVEGPYGILQPSSLPDKALELHSIDLAIVPAVAFDKNNHRLGRGAGYFDRFLKDLPQEIPAIGLAFDFQVVDSIPELHEHDIPVSQIITN